MTKPIDRSVPSNAGPSQRPRANSLSNASLARVFYQPSVVYFQAVAEDLSIRGAARRLNVASSAVTRQVAQLEDALGMDLFIRDGQKLKLSAAGQLLHEYTKHATKPFESALRQLEGLRRFASGTVSVAVLESVGISFMPSLLVAFARQYPAIEIRIVALSSKQVITETQDGKVDIGLGLIDRHPPDLNVVFQRSVSVGILMNSHHPLAKAAVVSRQTLTEYPCAIIENGLAERLDLISLVSSGCSVNPRAIIRTNSMEILVGLTKIGEHVAITTSLTAASEIDEGQLTFKPFIEPEINKTALGLMTRNRTQLSPAATALLDFTMTYIQSLKLPGDDASKPLESFDNTDSSTRLCV